MSAFITLDSVAAVTPDGRPLFENLDLAVGVERIGLVGRNGVGKSTLLDIMAGGRAPAAGTVTRTGSLARLDQSPARSCDDRLVDLLGAGPDWDRLARIEAGQADDADLSDADWDLPGRIAQALAEAGLPDLDPERPALSLSGGQATRAALARLLLARPDVLLLDEPTNNLDAAAREGVIRVIDRWKGGVVVVSHDRALLRGLDRIVELSSLGARTYGGGYDLYVERRDEEAAAASRDLDRADQEAHRVARDAQAARERKARRDAAGKRSAAKGGAPKIVLGAMAERAELSGAREGRLAQRLAAEAAEARSEAVARVERHRTLSFDLPSTQLSPGKAVLAFEAVAFGWPGGPPLISGLSFQIVGPERVAIPGSNGTGKTTLIRLAAGDLEPARGTIRCSVPMAVLDQRAAVLDDGQTILENFRRLNSRASANEAHAALARFLFRNAGAHQRVGTLSGGERLRAALACVLSAEVPPQLLILDEPTNHLDIASIEAVEAALMSFDGALLVVSHDADFLTAIGIEREIALGR